MNRHSARLKDDRTDTPSSLRHLAWAAAATVAIGLLYAVVFHTTMGLAPVEATLYAVTNAVPLSLLAVLFGIAVRTVVWPLPPPAQIALHGVFAPAFAATWYGCIVVLQAILRVTEGRPFEVGHFSPQALAWQSVQGLAVYAAIAATIYAISKRQTASPQPPSDRLDRYFRKAGDTIHCVNVRDIVSISGAQDYSDVATVSGRHLARFSLAEFERRLDPARFLRVHRSGIVNLDHFERAEPAGSGCFLVTLRNGETVRTSREGARRLRALTF